MITKQQLGFLFQNKIHDLISQTNYQVLEEKEIVKKYSRLTFGIDHIINSYNYIFCIQDKWSDKKSSLSDINHFVKCVEVLQSQENYKKCIGIYLTKIPITSDAQDAFNFENYKGYNYFLSLYDNDMKEISKKLTNLLYSYGVFFYECDGSSIMISD